VISGPCRTCRTPLVAALLLFCTIVAFADSKTVRLRNEPIVTPPKKEKAAAASDHPHSGLFLVQLIGPAKAEWLAELREKKVSVVQYVPDDAFVARAHGVRLSTIESLPFVRWTGPFKSDHKIYQKIRGAKKDSELSISVLLAADATAQQLGAARGLLKKIDSESSLRSGHVWRGRLNGGNLKALADSDAVLWIEAAPKMKLNDETAAKIIAGDGGGHDTYVQSLGYDGSGVVVSVADSGFDAGETDDIHPDVMGRVDAMFHYGELTDASDEHGHGTHVAGIIAGNGATGETDDYGALWGLGVAPGVHLVIQRLFDGEGAYYAPPSYLLCAPKLRGADARCPAGRG
jgi:serine protease AprX